MYHEELISLHKKMLRIESTDPNFNQNPKWQKLKKLQSEFYYKNAVMELDYRLTKRQTEKDLERIQQCKEFIERYEKENKNDIKL